MKSTLLYTLKFLALQGATRHPIHISSIRLSKKLKVSQQSASRYVLDLVESGNIERKHAQGGQIITIKEKGISLLRKEFSEYSLIFGRQKYVEMTGSLETGLGEGGYYISKKGYMEQFKKILKWTPYEGTLNLRLEENEVPKIEAMKAAEGILINGFEEDGRTFGKALIFKGVLSFENEKIKKCAVISPKRTHYKRVIEIISPHFIRKKLSVEDGAEISVKIDLGDI